MTARFLRMPPHPDRARAEKTREVSGGIFKTDRSAGPPSVPLLVQAVRPATRSSLSRVLNIPPDETVIAGYELVSAEERDNHVDAFRDMVSRAREFDGCIHFAVTADSVDPERISAIEVWQDAEVLKQWRKKAKPPRLDNPRKMAVQRYNATDGGRL